MKNDVMNAAHEEAGLNTDLNIVPLTDVMLVLLIIFLITVPVVVKTVPVALPTVSNIPTQTKPENIVIAVDRNENVYWNNAPVADNAELLNLLKEKAVMPVQPEVHIRGDKSVRFEAVGRVVLDCQRAGILKVGFITEPEAPGTYMTQ
ncbi:MAG: biopolymer transporter ExbD [Alphaproteobacteria bacterium]|nr:biopolymer transporter ExbD [Alphaproteobacteria bacterium]OJU58244.1 MAG: biopolymer transporter ExbD [Alphaproteobacteria bacterium 62-8]